jgi:ferredoxin-NADP reductase
MRAKIVGRSEIAENTIMMDLEPEQKLSFKPGQYMVLNLLNPKYTDVEGSTRIFSIISSPEERTVSFATRLSHSAFKRSLNELKLGDFVEIKYVGGKFELPGAKRKIAMIAGGIGIAPFMSMLKTAWEKSPDYDITLFYSNRTGLSTAFIEELKAMAEKNRGLHLALTMTREPRWESESGRVDEMLIRKYVKRPSETVFMIVGPGEMILDISRLIVSLGVPKEQVLSESFTGR